MGELNTSTKYRIVMVVLIACMMIVAVLKVSTDNMERNKVRKATMAMLMSDCKLVHKNMLERTATARYECPDGTTYDVNE